MVLCMSGCKQKEKAVTKQEALDFAKNLEASIAEKTPAMFNDLFDAETLKQRIKEASKKRITRFYFFKLSRT